MNVEGEEAGALSLKAHPGVSQCSYSETNINIKIGLYLYFFCVKYTSYVKVLLTLRDACTVCSF